MGGGVHGVYLIIENILTRLFGRRENNRWYVRLPKIAFCFALACFAWIFFRANNVTDAFTVIGKIFTQQGSLFISPMVMLFGGISIFILLIKDVSDEFTLKLKFLNSPNAIISFASAVILFVFVLLFGVLDNSQFIYFQF